MDTAASSPGRWWMFDLLFRVGHEYQDRVSLELARRIAVELPHRPEWMALAQDNLARWSERNRDAPGLMRCYAEWRAILAQPLKEVCAFLVAETDTARRLRTSSPFAGALSPREVWDIKERMRHDPTPT